MPFFKPANKNTGCVSLQVQKRLKKQVKNKYHSRKRAYLFASEGGITIEATIALSTFMLFVLFIESFMMVINSNMAIQCNINNIALETAKYQFYLQLVETTIEKSETLTDIKKELETKVKDNIDIPENLSNSIEKGVETAYLSQRLISKTGLDAFQDNLCRIGNLKLSESSISDEIIDMVVEYKMKIPYVNRQIHIAQRGRVRAWTGEDISQKQIEVYITKTGQVYHKTRDCSSLIVKISKAYYSQIPKLRNSNGGKYSKCALCVKEKLTNTSEIFITEDGNKYHKDLKCSGIKRNVIAIDISQVENKNPCSKCGQGE